MRNSTYNEPSSNLLKELGVIGSVLFFIFTAALIIAGDWYFNNQEADESDYVALSQLILDAHPDVRLRMKTAIDESLESDDVMTSLEYEKLNELYHRLSLKFSTE